MRTPSSPHQHVAKLDSVSAIHVEKVDGGASFGSQTENSSFEKTEMMVPAVLAWVEKGGHLTRVGIERSDIRSLLQVASDAAKTKIIDAVSAVVLAPNDVVDLVR